MAITLAKPPLERRSAFWLDGLVLLGLTALVFGVAQVAAQWRHPLVATVDINLSPRSLPLYAFFSFARGWIAYFLSLFFTVLIASWAYYDVSARRYIVPALDILQSVPVLAFLPGLELGLVGLFPHSNTGLELACILSIFTGQVWNMTFSYYDSLRGLPADFRMLGKFYNFNWWNRFWRIELPFGAQPLLYNSMVSMAGGWFFLSVCEAFSLGDKNFQVPGIGSYFAVAVQRHDVRAQVCGIIAMGCIIVIVDRLIWSPLIKWSVKFKLDDFGSNRAGRSRLQLWLARSLAIQRLAGLWQALQQRLLPPPEPPSAESSLAALGAPPIRRTNYGKVIYILLISCLVAVLAWGGARLFVTLSTIHPADWIAIARNLAITLGRVMITVLIGTIWTVPFGIWIGLNPKLSNRLQPFIQFVASFPSPMLFPWLLALIFLLHGTLRWGSILLLLFGTQWYILFNVAGAAAAIPNDIISCAEILRLKGLTRWFKFLIPAVLPGLVTGWLTAAGGAWNTTIVAEYFQDGDKLYQTSGLGAYISRATANGEVSHVAAAAIVMAVTVVVINRTVWKRLQAIANDRCRFIT
jgi:NitT/TauT family transport system permease protein